MTRGIFWNMFGKKAEVSTSFIVTLIILVISFVIILFVVFTFDWSGTISKEACHESAVYRSLKWKFVEASEVLPLKCQTEQICFSMSGKDCKELTSTKDNPVKKVKLSKDPDKAREKIKEVLAESMVDCHWMFGEGKLDFMPHHSTVWDDTPYGLICNWVVLDDEAKENVKDISYGEFYAYLEQKTRKDGRSYLEYLYPGWRHSSNSIKLFEQFKQSNREVGNTALEGVEFKDWKMDLDAEDGNAVIVIMAPEGEGAEWLGAGFTSATVLGGALLIISGVGAPLGVGLMGLSTATATVAGGAVFWYSYDEDYSYAPPTIYPFNTTELRKMGVYQFEVAP